MGENKKERFHVKQLILIVIISILFGCNKTIIIREYNISIFAKEGSTVTLESLADIEKQSEVEQTTDFEGEAEFSTFPN